MPDTGDEYDIDEGQAVLSFVLLPCCVVSVTVVRVPSKPEMKLRLRSKPLSSFIRVIARDMSGRRGGRQQHMMATSISTAVQIPSDWPAQTVS